MINTIEAGITGSCDTCEARMRRANIRTLTLDGQAAIVTGANSGIGEAIARCIPRRRRCGHVNYVANDDRATSIVADIRAAGGKALALRADVSREDEVAKMFERAVAEFGTVDILVNNAGLQRDAPLHEMTLDQWHHVIDVNSRARTSAPGQRIREFLRRGVVAERSCSAGKIICRIVGPRRDPQGTRQTARPVRVASRC